jgi:hypothetical protein
MGPPTGGLITETAPGAVASAGADRWSSGVRKGTTAEGGGCAGEGPSAGPPPFEGPFRGCLPSFSRCPPCASFCCFDAVSHGKGAMGPPQSIADRGDANSPRTLPEEFASWPRHLPLTVQITQWGTPFPRPTQAVASATELRASWRPLGPRGVGPSLSLSPSFFPNLRPPVHGTKGGDSCAWGARAARGRHGP